jgi:hypothetical protein
MKSQHRHELQQNELASRLVDVVDWCKQNAPLLLGAVVGVIVVIGAFSYFRHRSATGAAAEWSAFFSAAGRQDTVKLDSIGVANAGDTTGQLANLLLGDTHLASGIEQMSSDRTAAEEQLNQAKTKYSKVRQTATDSLLLQRAALGLARYYETVGLLDDAVVEYEKLTKEWSDGPFAGVAKRKIEYLQLPSTRAFSKWYAEHKPLPPSASPRGTMPGLGDLNKLPDDEKSFPDLTPRPTASPTASPTAGPTPSPTATPTAK